MALSINFTAKTQYGDIQVPGCYVRVTSVEVSKTDAWARIAFLKAIDQGVMQEGQHSFPYKLDGGNPITQTYEYLKTLPEFAGAVDC